MFSSPIVIGMILAASIILGFLYLCTRGKRNQSNKAGDEAEPMEPGTLSGRILWDAADGGRRPIFRNDTVSLDRRSFLSRAAASALALVGLAAVGAAAHATSASSGTGASSSGSYHSDSPHTDKAGHHTDISCDPPTCLSHEHVDSTSHNDTPHGDTA